MLNFNKNKSIASMLASGMPNMADTLTGWEIPLTLIRITQDVINGDLVESRTTINFIGCWQPLSNEELQLKPEGQRNWSYYWIHAKSNSLILNVADKVIYKNQRYKVLSKKDYSLNGFVEYEVILDYEQST